MTKIMQDRNFIFCVLLLLSSLAASNWTAAQAQNQNRKQISIVNVDRAKISLDDLILISAKKTTSISALNSLFTQVKADVIGTIGKDDLLLYEVLVSHSRLSSVSSVLKKSPLISKVLKNIKFPPATTPTPNDPDYNNQYHLRVMKAPQAWNDNHNGQHIPIAILDTGCENQDLSGHMYPGYDAVLNQQNAGTTDPNGHGSMVASTAAAVMGNFKGGVGVAYSSYIMPIKIADSHGSGYLNAILRAIDYCANWDGGPFHEKINIINISYSNLTSSGPDSEHVELHKRFKWFHDQIKGLIFVAAGNDGRFDNSPKQPYLIVVAANQGGNPGKLASFSNRGNCIWFNAPGTSIVCMDNQGKTVSPDGTSFASPIVAAMAANIWSHSLASNLKIEQILKSGSVLPDGSINNGLGSDNKWDSTFGYGMPAYNPQPDHPPDHGDQPPDRRRPNSR